MAVAASLEEAAWLAWANLQVKSGAATLRTNMLAFATACEAVFPFAEPNNHPVANWIAVIRCFASSMSAVANIWNGTGMRTAAMLVYRACQMGQVSSSQNLITAPQTAAMLAAYNAQFA